MIKRRYVLKAWHYKLYEKKHGCVECYKCRSPLGVDDEVCSRGNYGGTGTKGSKLYCIACARDLYFVDD